MDSETSAQEVPNEMTSYRLTVHVSSNFRRTSDLAYGFDFTAGDSFAKAAADGVYDDNLFFLTVEADSPRAAAEVAFAVCNSYPGELHCDARYADDVAAYRSPPATVHRRSLSMGDVVSVHHADSPAPGDGRYVVARVGFDYLDGEVAA